jgi:hypothetical protein
MKMYGALMMCLSATFTCLAAENTIDSLESFKEKINLAIIKFENTDRALWSYTISRYEDEEGDVSSSIEQHFSSAHIGDGEQWQLKQINGQLPTKKQIKKFAKNKQKQSNAEGQGVNLQLSLRKLINQKSLSLVSTDDKHLIMAFDVSLEKLGKDAVGKLQGKLTYQKDKQFIEQISIWNNADFSPMFTANITDLALAFTFININGAVLTKQNEMKMKGSFAYFTEINETSTDNFSDYYYQNR